MLWLANLLTGGILDKILGFFTTVTTSVATVETTKLTTAAQVTIGQQSAAVALGAQAAQMAIADKGWWLTAAMKPVAFYTFMVGHVIPVVLDTTFKLNWGIPKLPSPYDAMEANVIYLCLGIAGAYGLTRIFSR